MHRIKLDMDAVEVESFATGSMDSAAGTVRAFTGNSPSCMAYCLPQASQDVEHCGGNETVQTCPSVNNYTCYGASCGYTQCSTHACGTCVYNCVG